MIINDVLAIAATDTENHARAAADKVHVELDVLPAYMTSLEAIAEDALDNTDGISEYVP